MSDRPTNIGASVRQRLLNISRNSDNDFVVTLTDYALERLLYRLSRSQHKDRFVLKGAMLFRIWSDEPHRATRDLDLLAFGSPFAEDIAGLFREICEFLVEDDGVQYKPDSIRTEEIRETQEYDGVRVKLIALISGARVPLQIDVGFGDSVVPPATEIAYPTLLDFPAPRIRVYSRETVIAEKFHAMVTLGIVNSRMKDFHDIYTLATTCRFSGSVICSAIKATFESRSMQIPQNPPIALTEEFSKDSSKITQWSAFITNGSVKTASVDLSEVIELLHLFLLPPIHYLFKGEPFDSNWVPPGPWSQ
jgi:predicted nucleotidyltransferase component of viral defense system